MEGTNLHHREPPQQGPGGHPPQHTDESGKQCLPGPALSTALLGEPKPTAAGRLEPRLSLSLWPHRVPVAVHGPSRPGASGRGPPSAARRLLGAVGPLVQELLHGVAKNWTQLSDFHFSFPLSSLKFHYFLKSVDLYLL